MSVTIIGELGQDTAKIAVTSLQSGLGMDLVDTQRQKDRRFDVSLRQIK